MEKITRLDKFRVPVGNQEIELQQIEFAAGGLLFLRLRIREHRRFTIFDIDPVTAGRWAEVMASWLPGLATASLTWRTHPRALDRGSLQFDWTYPVSAKQPAGLRWYAQVFTGYGETLLDYNHRQTSVGLGLTLFQF